MFAIVSPSHVFVRPPGILSLSLSLLVALIIAVACAFGDPVVLHIHVLSPTALLDSFIHPNFEMENQVYCLMLHFWEEEDDDHTPTTTRESTVSLLNQVRVCSRARLAQDNDENYNEERIKCINNLGQRIATRLRSKSSLRLLGNDVTDVNQSRPSTTVDHCDYDQHRTHTQHTR